VGSYRLVMSGTIDGEPFTALQECEMECDEEAGDDCDIECEAFTVVDNAFSCAGGTSGKSNVRIRKFLQCLMQEE